MTLRPRYNLGWKRWLGPSSNRQHRKLSLAYEVHVHHQSDWSTEKNSSMIMTSALLIRLLSKIQRKALAVACQHADVLMDAIGFEATLRLLTMTEAHYVPGVLRLLGATIGEKNMLHAPLWIHN